MSNAVADTPIDIDGLPEPKRFTVTEMQWWLANKIDLCRVRSGAISPESFLRVESEDIAILEAMHRFFASIYPHREKVSDMIAGRTSSPEKKRK